MEKINYTLTIEDCNNYAKSQNKIPRLKKMIAKDYLKFCFKYSLFLFLLALIIFGFIIYNVGTTKHLTLFSVITNKDFLPFFVYFFINSFVVIILFVVILLIILYVKLYFWDGKYIYIMLEGTDLNYELSISGENITRTNKNGINIFNWDKIKDIYDTKYNYLIFISDRQAIIIPKRCFENEEQGKEFYNNIQKYYSAVQKG